MLMFPYDAAWGAGGTLSRGKWKGKRDDHAIYRKRARRQKVKAARKANVRRARG